MIEKIRAAGRPGWANHLEWWVDSLWGRNRGMASTKFDELTQRIPILKHYVHPFALERWLGSVKTGLYWAHLQTGRFYVLNSLQPVQTLWPVVGSRGLLRGYRLYYSKAGRELMRRHEVSGISSKLHESGMRGHRFERWTPAGASEIRNQGVAFLSLYDYATRKLKMNDADAARYARLRGQVMTQFAYSPADVPRLARGPIGGLLLQYKRFPIKNLELVSTLIREKRYGGVARWALAQMLIGGLKVTLKSATFGGAAWLTYAIWRGLDDDWGEEVADAVVYGLPALLGVDMSGSVQMIPEARGRSIAESVGEEILGPAGQTVLRTLRGMGEEKTTRPLSAGERAWKQALTTSPTLRQFDELLKALRKDTSSMDTRERQLYAETVWDKWKKAFGFRPMTESKQRMLVEAMWFVKQEYDEMLDKVSALVVEGRIEEAEAILSKWNARWPEAEATLDDVARRVEERVRTREEPAIRRVHRQLPKKLRLQFQEQVEDLAPEE